MTKFPEPAHREIGFTADWDAKPPAPSTCQESQYPEMLEAYASTMIGWL